MRTCIDCGAANPATAAKVRSPGGNLITLHFCDSCYTRATEHEKVRASIKKWTLTAALMAVLIYFFWV